MIVDTYADGGVLCAACGRWILAFCLLSFLLGPILKDIVANLLVFLDSICLKK